MRQALNIFLADEWNALPRPNRIHAAQVADRGRIDTQHECVKWEKILPVKPFFLGWTTIPCH